MSHACDPASEEAAAVGIFRFAAAPAFRTWCVGRGLEGCSVDYALPKAEDHEPTLEPVGAASSTDGGRNRREDHSRSAGIGGGSGEVAVLRMRYSHFGCNVVHEDVAFRPGVDAQGAKMALKRAVEGMRGKLPAEHGHGMECVASSASTAPEHCALHQTFICAPPQS